MTNLSEIPKQICDWLQHNYVVVLFLLLPVILFLIYKNSVRFTEIYHVKPNTSFKGTVIQIGDGDGFRIVHIPLFRSNSTDKVTPLVVRMAGIDAPEVRCFGRPAQAYSSEARDYLRTLILNKKVTVKILDVDRYSRLVCMVYIKTGIFQWMNVNIEMLKAGMACVFTSGFSSFDGMEDEFKAVEAKAKATKKGMWSQKSMETPMEYKARYRSKV